MPKNKSDFPSGYDKEMIAALELSPTEFVRLAKGMLKISRAGTPFGLGNSLRPGDTLDFTAGRWKLIINIVPRKIDVL